MAKVYKELAQVVGALKRCEADAARAEWSRKHRARIGEIVKRYLPSGSGFDCGTDLDLEASSEERLTFHTSFHHMDQNGCYDGWTEHTIVVTPSLAFGFRLRITGRDRNQIKDLISQSFEHAMSEQCTVPQ